MLLGTNNRGILPILICSVVALSGCAAVRSGGPEFSLFGGGRVTSAGVNQLFDEDFEAIDLSKSPHPEWATWKSAERNNLQGRILAAANQRCGLYEVYLKQLQGNTNVTLGTLATLLGGAGAIVTAADTARALAGSAGIVSGSRAEFNQGVFLNAAIPVILKGIEQRRERLRAKILERLSEEVSTYPVSLAVADAIDYHNACNLGKGLEEANAALELREHPGLEAMQKALKLINATDQELTTLQVAKLSEQLKTLQEEIKKAEANLKKLQDASKDTAAKKTGTDGQAGGS